VLNERERRIFEGRRLADEPITLDELAREYGVSRERVRQIEVHAFEKVQKVVKDRVAGIEIASSVCWRTGRRLIPGSASSVRAIVT
jgi:RNA polymerase sigma-32 factor